MLLVLSLLEGLVGMEEGREGGSDYSAELDRVYVFHCTRFSHPCFVVSVEVRNGRIRVLIGEGETQEV